MRSAGEVGKITEMVADAPTTVSLGKRYGALGGWGMAPGKVEILLVVGDLDVDSSAEA